MPLFKITRAGENNALMFLQAKDEDDALVKYVENRMRLGLNSSTTDIKANKC